MWTTPGEAKSSSIELDGPAARNLTLRCRGTIVRIEHRAGKVGLAVEIVASQARVSMGEEPQFIE